MKLAHADLCTSWSDFKLTVLYQKNTAPPLPCKKTLQKSKNTRDLRRTAKHRQNLLQTTVKMPNPKRLKKHKTFQTMGAWSCRAPIANEIQIFCAKTKRPSSLEETPQLAKLLEQKSINLRNFNILAEKMMLAIAQLADVIGFESWNTLEIRLYSYSMLQCGFLSPKSCRKMIQEPSQATTKNDKKKLGRSKAFPLVGDHVLNHAFSATKLQRTALGGLTFARNRQYLCSPASFVSLRRLFRLIDIALRVLAVLDLPKMVPKQPFQSLWTMFRTYSS